MTTSRHIGQLLRDAFDDFEHELLERQRAAGVEGLRPRFNAVLRYMDADGTRATELAARSGLTRQALTQIVDELEATGYVERRDDPSDRRAKLVVYTPKGLRAFEASRTVIADIEADYGRRLGKRRYAELRRALAGLLEGTSGR